MTSGEAGSDVRLVLHPGHPKCGSSSLQAALYASVEALEERGIYLPNRKFQFSFDSGAFEHSLGNPVRFFESIADERQLKAFEERLGEVVEGVRGAGGNTVVISAENLGNQPGITTRRPVHEILARSFDPVSVVFYMRRQDEWMVSSWQQWGHKLGWSLDQHIERNLSAHRPDFLGAARCFEEIYGSASVSVVPLSPQVLLEGDLVTDFARRTGIGPLEAPGGGPYKNASFGGFLCDILSRVPEVYAGHTDRTVRRLLEASVDSRDLLFSRDKRILSADQRRRVLSHFEPDNRTLHERYFGQVAFESVFGCDNSAESELAVLRDHIEGLKDVVAIQMELLLKLLTRQTADRRHRNPLLRLWRKRRPQHQR